MKSSHSFRVSLYLAVCLATFCLWLGEEAPLPYPWVVVLLAITAYAFTDEWDRVVIPPRLVPFAGLAALAFFIREEVLAFRSDPPDFVLPLGHVFVFFQVIWFFHRKIPRYYWYMIAMSFFQMAIAALHNNNLSFGVLMSVYLVLVLWTLTRSNLEREAQRRPDASATHARMPPVRRSLGASLAAGAAIVTAAMILFLVIPRQGETAWTNSQFRSSQYLSGFDDRIRLGQLGTILESDDEVMTVHLYDESGQPYRPREDPLWRGVTLAHYEDGRWERRVDISPPYKSPWLPQPPERFIRQEISLKVIHREVLFGMPPFFRGTTRGGEPLTLARLDGTLVRPDNVGVGPLQYTIESYVDINREPPQTNRVGAALDNKRREQYTQLPPQLGDQLRQYVATLDLPPANDEAQFIGQLLNHLRDPAVFDYTLEARVVDPGIDPVLDFLVNRKEGHCEYFASALALLLRAHDVPARVVNGFKGGDWNELLGKFIVVRQKHAHSWVESVLAVRDQPPHWVTLDPTPGQSRQRIVAQVSRTPLAWQQFRDMSRQLWSSYILNFNSGEQESAIYGPMRLAVTEQATKLVEYFRGKPGEESAGFNWPAAMGASVLAAGALFGLRLAARAARSWRFVWAVNGRGNERGLARFVARQIRRLLGYWGKSPESARHRVIFYDVLLRTLESHGIHKQPTWTPQQFAEHARAELDRATRHAAVAPVPAAIVDRFYRVRFGDGSLTEPEVKDTEALLRTLALALANKE